MNQKSYYGDLIMQNNNSNNLLTAIQMYDFYLYELQLYLDTHPTCRKALAAFRRYSALREEAYKMYAEKCGPLTPSQSRAENCFEWAEGPWPWERSDG